MKTIEPSRPEGRRVYLESNGGGVRVPIREIAIEPPNAPVRLYDTSGPYGDPSYRVDLDRGLPRLRSEWIRSGTSSWHGRVMARTVPPEASLASGSPRTDPPWVSSSR